MPVLSPEAIRQTIDAIAELPVEDDVEALLAAARDQRPRNAAGQAVRYITEDDLKRERIAFETDADTVARRWGERRADLNAEFRLRRLFHAIYTRAYEGHAFDYVNASSFKIQPIRLPAWFPSGNLHQIEFNRARPIINETISEMTTPHGVLEVNPRSSSQPDQDAARKANKLVWYWAESKRIKALQRRSALWDLIWGEFYIKTEWDERQVCSVKARDGATIRGMFGDVSFSLVHPGRLYVPRGSDAIDEAEWVIEERVLGRTEVLRQWPDAARYLGPQRPERDDWPEDDYRFYYYDARSDLEDLVDAWSFADRANLPESYRVYECFEKFFDPQIGYYWWRTVLCRGYVIEDGIYAPLNEAGEIATDYFGNPVAWDLPYTHVKYNDVPERFHGQGLVRDIIKPLRFMRWLDSLAAKTATDSAVRIMATPMGPEPTPFYDQGFIQLRYQDEPPTFMDTGGVPTIISELLGYYERMLREIAMRPDVVRGEAPANRSGKAINVLATEAKGMILGNQERFDEGWQMAFEKALWMAQVLYSEERLLGINEDDGAGSFALKGADLRGHADVRMNYSPLYGHTRRDRIELGMQLAGAGIYSPEEVRQIIKAGAHEDTADIAEMQARRGREMIYRIEALSPEAASGLVEAIGRIQSEIGAALDEPGGEGLAEGIDTELWRAQNDVLNQAGIGLSIYDDPGIQGAEIQRAGILDRHEAMGAEQRAILALRFQLCRDEARRRLDAEAARQAALAAGPGGQGGGAAPA